MEEHLIEMISEIVNDAENLFHKIVVLRSEMEEA